jgi:hypothetical protein
VIKWINAAGAKLRESYNLFLLLRRSDISLRAIRRGAKVVNEDERVAMGRIHAPSLRPGTSNAARGSDQCAPGHDYRMAGVGLSGYSYGRGRRAFEPLSNSWQCFRA